jgi:hypothetical protein
VDLFLLGSKRTGNPLRAYRGMTVSPFPRPIPTAATRESVGRLPRKRWVPFYPADPARGIPRFAHFRLGGCDERPLTSSPAITVWCDGRPPVVSRHTRRASIAASVRRSRSFGGWHSTRGQRIVSPAGWGLPLGRGVFSSPTFWRRSVRATHIGSLNLTSAVIHVSAFGRMRFAADELTTRGSRTSSSRESWRRLIQACSTPTRNRAE